MSHTPGTRHILLAGASGLIGREVLGQLLERPDVAQVVTPGRRKPAVASPKVLAITSDLADPTALEALDATLARVAPHLDVFFCCLGTTLRAAGSKPAFLAVDRDLIIRLATLARRLGARHAVVVSSVGASAQSGNFYLRVKGETERLLSGLGFERLDILRPGLLLGQRDEHRPGERWAQRIMPVLNPLLPGGLSRYRAIPATTVASAMVALLDAHAPGHFVHQYCQLVALSAAAG